MANVQDLNGSSLPSVLTKTTWRLIPYLEAPGQQQMALDSWLLQDYVPRTQQPVLRFYGWCPVAISLGYCQHHYPEHWGNLRWQGQPLDLVRRPSGGRAVLHQGTLTYAIVLPHWGSRKRRDHYTYLCEFLRQAWGSLGVELTYGSADHHYRHNASCFNTATAADLVALDGSKLIGSAQRYTDQALLQHGAMLLEGDPLLFEQVFGQTAPWKKGLLQRTSIPSLATLLEILETTARHYFGVEIISQALTPEEWTAIQALVIA
ncbi:biotin/lipoate A/B protein ligase family protein [Synechocystis sp. LKSZ1]|uniref:biotin/lipoate A/B protein ligase family protein n=1 Tax=Synechocystis sp. LKSZ1 TaxID=3144951 RepID=UPI00336C0385